MPERIPAPPPLRPIAASFSPVVWAAFLPDLFDSFSAGLVFLQMCVPQLRGRKVMDPNGAFRRQTRGRRCRLAPMEKGGGAAGMGLLGARRQRGAGMGPGVQAGVQAKLSAARKAGVQLTALLHPFFWTP